MLLSPIEKCEDVASLIGFPGKWLDRFRASWHWTASGGSKSGLFLNLNKLVISGRDCLRSQYE
jgi:hypothetical protein